MQYFALGFNAATHHHANVVEYEPTDIGTFHELENGIRGEAGDDWFHPCSFTENDTHVPTKEVKRGNVPFTPFCYHMCTEVTSGLASNFLLPVMSFSRKLISRTHLCFRTVNTWQRLFARKQCRGTTNSPSICGDEMAAAA